MSFGDWVALPVSRATRCAVVASWLWLLPLSFLLIKTMNLLLLGDGYARNLGLNIKRARLLVISCSGVLVAIVTAYCGPIMFIGLAVPHLCRAIFTLRTIGC